MTPRHNNTHPLGGGDAQALARGLGWLSIGLGVAELLAPGKLSRAVGMAGSERVVSTYGTREIVNGIGILTAEDPTPWVWGRVGGDALDLVTLATGLRPGNPRKAMLGRALLAVAGMTAIDVLSARLLRDAQRRARRRRFDYGDRSGLPRGVAAAHGAARDFKPPEDMRPPAAMRSWAVS